VKRPVELALQPLSRSELQLCRSFLSADLNQQAVLRELVESMRLSALGDKVVSTVSEIHEPKRLPAAGKFLTFESISVVSEDDRLGLAKSEDWLAYASESLPNLQRRWRATVVGPGTASKSDLRKDAFQDLDAYSLIRGEFQLPRFHLAHRFQRSALRYGRKRLLPTLRVFIRRPSDLFDWMFVRAVANLQLSRLAHCVVCGRWVLKVISGQRSQKKIKFLKQTKKRANSWPPIYRHLPLWPALCGQIDCKNTFFNAFSSRTPFRAEKFASLTNAEN
jgi:hypothetical protein